MATGSGSFDDEDRGGLAAADVAPRGLRGFEGVAADDWIGGEGAAAEGIARMLDQVPGKKVVIADHMALLVDPIFAHVEYEYLSWEFVRLDLSTERQAY